MRYGRQVLAATLGAALVFGGVAVGPVSYAPSAIAQTATAGVTATVGVDFLNVRDLPAVSGSILTTLPSASSVQVLAGPVAADGFDWYQIQGGTVSGWAVASFVLLSEDDAAPGTPARWVYGDAVTVNTDNLNVRELPAIDAPVLDVYPYGTAATVTGDATTVGDIVWYPVDRLGWVAGQYLSAGTPAGDDAAPVGSWVYGDLVTVTTDTLNVRELPTASAPVLATYTTGKTATITGDATTADGTTWYPVDNLGWVAGQFLGDAAGSVPAPSTPTPTDPSGTTGFNWGDTVVVSTDLLNVRGLPGTTQPILKVYPSGTQAKITGPRTEADGFVWYAVDNIGWVVGDFLTLATAALAAPTESVGPVPSVDPAMSTAPNTSAPAAVASASDAAAASVAPSTAPSSASSTASTRPSVAASAAASSDEGDEAVASSRPSPIFVTPTVAAPAVTEPVASASVATEPAEAAPTEAAGPVDDGSAFSAGDLVVVDTGRLNIRSSPSYDAAVIRIVDNGAEFTIYGEPVVVDGDTWYRVSETQEEWVDGQFLAAAE